MPEPLDFFLRLECDLIDRPNHSHRITFVNKVTGGYRFVKCIVALVIAITLAPFLVWHKDISMGIVSGCALVNCVRGSKLFEDVLWVEEFGINGLGSIKLAADNEDFGRDISTTPNQGPSE